MELKIKNYKYLKIRKYIETSKFFLIYNGTNLKYFIRTEQKLKNLNLEYYKIYNSLTKKILQKSIYKNYNPIINGFIIVIKPKKNQINFSYKNFINLHEVYNLIGLKINNKIYPISFLDQKFQLNYVHDNLALFQSLKKILLIPSKLI